MNEAILTWLMWPDAPYVPTTLEEMLGRPAWMARAACRGCGPKEFVVKPTDAARALCDHCSVREDCLSFALAREDLVGVWGGMDEKERRSMRRRAVA